MIYDTNLLIQHIRRQELPPVLTVIPFIVVGELEAFALKADWGAQRVMFMHYVFDRYPVADLERDLIPVYAQIDAYSQNKIKLLPLKTSARNMGKNDIWAVRRCGRGNRLVFRHGIAYYR